MKYLVIFYLLTFTHIAFGKSYERFIKVQFVDYDSNEGIQNIEITTEYRLDETNQSYKPTNTSAFTDSNGEAILKISIFDVTNPSKPHREFDEPIFKIDINDDIYKIKRGYRAKSAKNLVTRNADHTPILPDKVFKLMSIESREQRRLEYQKEKQELELKAIKILENNPSYWPELDQYGNIKDKVGDIILRKKWELAKNSGILNEAHVLEIKSLFEEKYKCVSNLSIANVSFLNENTAMADVSVYCGPLAAAGYTYVLQRINGKWEIYREYIEYIV